MTEEPHPRVAELFPDFAAEIVAALVLDAEEDLAAQIPHLAFWGRCSCDDDFCASFYTGPRPRGRWSDDGDHKNVVLAVEKGMIVFDLVDGAIRYVEVCPAAYRQFRAWASIAPAARGRPGPGPA